jgi:hypothetical protein
MYELDGDLACGVTQVLLRSVDYAHPPGTQFFSQGTMTNLLPRPATVGIGTATHVPRHSGENERLNLALRAQPLERRVALLNGQRLHTGQHRLELFPLALRERG